MCQAAAENPVAFDRGYVDDLGRLLQAYRPGIEIVNDGGALVCISRLTVAVIQRSASEPP